MWDHLKCNFTHKKWKRTKGCCCAFFSSSPWNAKTLSALRKRNFPAVEGNSSLILGHCQQVVKRDVKSLSSSIPGLEVFFLRYPTFFFISVTPVRSANTGGGGLGGVRGQRLDVAMVSLKFNTQSDGFQCIHFTLSSVLPTQIKSWLLNPLKNTSVPILNILPLMSPLSERDETPTALLTT